MTHLLSYECFHCSYRNSFLLLVRMFPSVSSCASNKKNSVGHLLFFLLSHLLRNYLTDSNETCLLCSPQCLAVQLLEKIRSVDKFGRLVPGSDLVKFPINRHVISSPPRPLVGFCFRSWSECSPQCLVVQVPK